MADKSPKKVYNTLLNVSVTGATFEEFSQNALLCPASVPETSAALTTVPLNNESLSDSKPEILPPQISSSEQINANIYNPAFQAPQQQPQFFDTQRFTPPQLTCPSYNNQQLPSASGLFPDNQQQHQQGYTNQTFPLAPAPAPAPPDNTNSSVSSVFSSFSNILSFGSQKKEDKPYDNLPLTHSVETFNIPESNVSPVPLYSAQTFSNSPSILTPHLPPQPATGNSILPPRSTSLSTNSGIYSNSPPVLATNLPPPPAHQDNFILPPSLTPPSTNSGIYSNPSSVLTPNLPPPPVPANPGNSVLLPPGLTPPPLAQGNSVLPPSLTPLSASSGVFSKSPSTLNPNLPPKQASSVLSPHLNTPTAQLPLTTLPSSVPLVPAQVPLAKPPSSSVPLPPLQAAGNTYRRQTQKKLSYAPIPGFSTTSQQPQPQLQLQTQPQLATNFQSPTYEQNIYNPQQKFTPSFINSLDSSKNYTSAAPSFLIPSSDLSEIQSLDCTPSTFLTPDMSKIPAGEIPSSTNPATLNSSTTSHTIKNAASPGMPEVLTPEASSKVNASPYRPVYHHWFHKREIEGRVIWQPFSMVDSLALEAAFVSTDISPEHMVATDGGRYDVNILRRQRSAVYWEGTPTEVRRCSWFYKGNNDGRFTPYEENIATKLEEEYKAAYEVNQWHRKVELPNGETVMFHAPDVLVLFPQSATPDMWNNAPPTTVRPRVVKRGMDEFDIDEGEPGRIDHLLFLVHGIGSVCDLKFRSVEEVVDDFRSISLQLVQSHYKSSCDKGIANRIEVLPVSWHNQLHSEDTGIDRKLKSITLESIPRLRDFTNDTLLDILFYTSPIYCQTIIATVGNELNRIYELFNKRNPGFKGSVSVGGHSLGSLILFDILCHQHPVEKDDEKETKNGGSDEDTVPPMKSVEKPLPAHRRLSRRISYMMGKAGTGQPFITYPHLNFQPIAFFALGSPIGMFVTVRGLESLGEQFALPTCPAFFNIFHPYDPVAYRIESLINVELGNARPVLIPHHKGRKRMHLELKETMARVGADLKQRVMDSVKSTWNSVYQLTMFNRQETRSIEVEVDKVLEEQLNNEENDRTRYESVGEEDGQTDLPVGILNKGRRIDYVLQEAPFEFFNEYIFALTSHVCYWESEDTMLLILKEIYNSMGINTDSQIPQQTMTIERSTPSPVGSGETPRSLQMANPMRPAIYSTNLSPPSTSGFIRKT